jgi:hypothetical protein
VLVKIFIVGVFYPKCVLLFFFNVLFYNNMHMFFE